MYVSTKGSKYKQAAARGVALTTKRITMSCKGDGQCGLQDGQDKKMGGKRRTALCIDIDVDYSVKPEKMGGEGSDPKAHP